MTHAPPRPATPDPTLAAIFRHVGDAHQRLAFAPDADVVAACLVDLYVAMELLEEAEPALREKVVPA